MPKLAQLTPSKMPKGPYILILTVMWEYFSYYGMRGLLVLYLTQSLLFSDDHAYGLYGDYTSMVYVTPIIAGWIADRYLGYRWSMVLGGILIAIGHFILWLPESVSLYIGLATIIWGVGFFKGNSVCLISQCYRDDAEGKHSAMALYYVGGNIGAILAPILVSYVAQVYGFHMGFALAGFGMTLGLLAMAAGWRHYATIGSPTDLVQKATPLIRKRYCFALLGFILIGIALVVLILEYQQAGWVLLAITVISCGMVGKQILNANSAGRKGLYLILALSAGSLIFWVFDQQGGSSINLFIDRNINRVVILGGHDYLIPTALFQSFNSLGVLLFGSVIGILWAYLGRRGIRVAAILKMALGFVVITCGFMLFTLGAKVAALSGGHASAWFAMVGLVLTGFAELFIDPVVLAVIGQVSVRTALSVLTGFYYLISGAVANYAAGEVAKFAAVPDDNGHVNIVAAALQYHAVYIQVVYVGAACIVALIVMQLLIGRWEKLAG